MPSPPAYTIYGFGLIATLGGLNTLLRPRSSLEQMNLQESALPVMKASGLASFALGIYYVLLARQENRMFFKATVPMRCLSAIVLWRCGGFMKVVGASEGIGAAMTGLSLLLEG